MSNPTFYQQLQDYVLAIKQYISAATGVPLNRIVASPPDLAKRRLKEREECINPSTTVDATGNLPSQQFDKFISFYFPYSIPGNADDRTSVMQEFFGSVAQASRIHGWPMRENITIQIEVWGGPDQEGKSFMFEKRMMLKNYMRRHQRLTVQFTGLITKDPVNPTRVPFDVDCWYPIIVGDFSDNSNLEQMFEQGAIHRATAEAVLWASFYNIPSRDDIVRRWREIICEFEEPGSPDFETWSITTTSTTSTLSTTSTVSTSSTVSTVTTSSTTSSTLSTSSSTSTVSTSSSSTTVTASSSTSTSSSTLSTISSTSTVSSTSTASTVTTVSSTSSTLSSTSSASTMSTTLSSTSSSTSTSSSSSSTASTASTNSTTYSTLSTSSTLSTTSTTIAPEYFYFVGDGGTNLYSTLGCWRIGSPVGPVATRLPTIIDPVNVLAFPAITCHVDMNITVSSLFIKDSSVDMHGYNAIIYSYFKIENSAAVFTCTGSTIDIYGGVDVLGWTQVYGSGSIWNWHTSTVVHVYWGGTPMVVNFGQVNLLPGVILTVYDDRPIGAILMEGIYSRGGGGLYFGNSPVNNPNIGVVDFVGALGNEFILLSSAANFKVQMTITNLDYCRITNMWPTPAAVATHSINGGGNTNITFV